jgi:hypothetical protein
MLERIANALNIDTMELFSTRLIQQNYKPGIEQGVFNDIQEIISEKLALIEQDLYENTRKVRELRELLKK